MTLAGPNTGGGGGGGIVPGALSWSNIYGRVAGDTNLQTISGITVPISIGAGHTGAGGLGYIKNGVASAYAGPFTVSAGDTLAWSILGDGDDTVSGTVTVKNNSDGSATLASFTYLVSA